MIKLAVRIFVTIVFSFGTLLLTALISAIISHCKKEESLTSMLARCWTISSGLFAGALSALLIYAGLL